MQPKTGPNASIRERSGIQERIDRIHWYHEFDFGNGLRAEAKTPDAQSHRRLWRFVHLKLDKIDFTGQQPISSIVFRRGWSSWAVPSSRTQSRSE